ncbi:substrate-binding domain-containing protein [Winogradskya consettensis]|uniref:VWFA domain-containing protein n=1 Tax=Winogradskya consettensis TaxID=113560 RepID=A0A919SJ20_9ACTN|nr:VWA domain-containing protein [Actinoplanes consettensis]GIM73312.1 hypothetical protein Aco04nite_34620 [Actinoplanes consettensis]
MPGRHRTTFRHSGTIAGVTALALTVAGAGAWLGYRRMSEQDCSGQVPLSVAAAPEVAPAVRDAAQRWMDAGAAVAGRCVAVSVTAAEPADAATTVARQHQVNLTGLSTGRSGSLPDVWIPDSSMWLLRISSEAPGFRPTDATPIATSPVVLAVPQPVAETLGWPSAKLGWKDLLAALGRKGPAELRPGIIDPNRDAASLAGLLALGGSAGDGAAGVRAKVGALRSLAANSSKIRDDLVQKFPRSAADVGTSLSAAPLAEGEVVRYNAARPAVPLAALYLSPAPAPLNYPFAVMPGAAPETASAAAGLHAALRDQAFLSALGAAGLREPGGRAATGFTAPAGAPAAPAPAATAVPGNDAVAKAAGPINQLLDSWSAITLPGRVLAVFDVSGSMSEKVATAGGLTRAEITRRAATQGLALFDDRWAVGNWIFSTELRGKQPWRELVPITPLSSGRDRLTAAIDKIRPKENGDTGLYDTALAAYRNVQKSWEPGVVNSVILFTDGVNRNPDGLTRTALLDRLTRLRDPKRPVRMVIIGIGTDVDRGELTAIAKATSSGGVYLAEDPATIGQIFLQAIGTRSGA